MTRRAPEAVLAALDMDTARREVYVEGQVDRQLLIWLARDCISDDVVVEDCDSLELPGYDGNRERLVGFAGIVSKHPRVIVLIDADNEPSIAPTADSVLVLTDRRDLEGYFLTEECLDKVLKVGLANASLSAGALLAAALTEGRKMGVLRRVSHEHSFKLPFRKTDLYPAIEATASEATVDIPRMVARLTTQSIGQSRVAEVLALHAEAVGRLEGTDDFELVHGKDACAIMGEILVKHGVSRTDAVRLLRMSMERDMVAAYPNLQHVIDFLCA